MFNYEEVKSAAERARLRLSTYNTPDMRDQIVDTALAMGYYLRGTNLHFKFCNIWLEVFREDQDMLDLLKKAF